jgi:quinol-cytochrome oxidoreductase complex cytochrome b subunit
MSGFQVTPDSDARRTPRRVALIRRETPARVLADPEELVMTAPHLLLREVVLFQVCVLVLSILSLFFDAPLEGIADPSNTPNPAKAPWYFLGLQELLHYFPPVVAGVLIPGLVVVAMVAIPYARVNLRNEGFLETSRGRKLAGVTVVTLALSALLVVFRVWPVLFPTLILFAAMVLPSLAFCPRSLGRRLIRIPLSNWIMTWFVSVTVVLTLIGILFRGPGWKWVWPWNSGVS